MADTDTDTYDPALDDYHGDLSDDLAEVEALPEDAVNTGTPSQVDFPWKATARTILQVVVALATVIPLVVANVYTDADALPAVVVQVLAVSAAVTRIMAIPQVNDLLGKIGLGATR